MRGDEDWEFIHIRVDIYITFMPHHSCLQVDILSTDF